MCFCTQRAGRPPKGARYDVLMPSDTGSIAYVCECGKKWVVEKAVLSSDGRWPCKCGRTIIVERGAIYGSRKK